jgi:membrane-bound serine protease (ClpP class)
MAMVDRGIEIPGVIEKGKLLTLTYRQAQEHGFADYIVQDREELLKALEMDGAEIIIGKQSTAETLTRFATNPYIASLLLMIGIAGIVIELFTVGFGIAGLIGIISLTLYFGGHLMAGFSGWEAILLFLLGIILLAVEAFFPGFGLPGIGGIISIAASIIIAAPNWETGIISLVLALAGTIVLVLISFKVLTRRKIWDKLVLGTKYNTEAGYVPQKEDLSIYVGKRGEAVTLLRPAGTVLLEDGTKLDVVTDGAFIQKGAQVEVVRAEGVSLVVREVKQE